MNGVRCPAEADPIDTVFTCLEPFVSFPAENRVQMIRHRGSERVPNPADHKRVELFQSHMGVVVLILLIIIVIIFSLLLLLQLSEKVRVSQLLFHFPRELVVINVVQQFLI